MRPCEGYMFPDASSIAPFLEHAKTGPTASFCKALAGRLECVVVAGFPERLVSVSGDPPPPPPPTSTESRSAGANAAGVYDPTGLRHVYHKSNLFPTDRTWACPGGGFTTVDLPLPSSPSHTNDVEGSSDANATATAALPVRTAVAICNDLNVTAGETWTSIEHGPYELAGFCAREGVRVVVLLNAWLRSEDGGMERVGDRERERGVDGNEDEGEEEEEEDVGEEDDGEPNWEVLNYWAMRLRPLWAAPEPNAVDNKTRTGAEEATQSADANAQQDVIVVVCNRTGRERGALMLSFSLWTIARRVRF